MPTDQTTQQSCDTLPGPSASSTSWQRFPGATARGQPFVDGELAAPRVPSWAAHPADSLWITCQGLFVVDYVQWANCADFSMVLESLATDALTRIGSK